MKAARPKFERFGRGVDDLATLFPEIASEWHPVRNEELTPNDVSAGAGSRAWWLCKQGHEWQALVSARTRIARPTACPYCVGKRVVTGENDLRTVAPELAKEFSPRNSKPASEVNPNSKTNYLWECAQRHEWKTTPRSRKAGSNCPYCNGKLIKAGDNDLFSEVPELETLWDYDRNSTEPASLTLKSRESFYWKCPDGHEWQARVYTMATRKNCRLCDTKGTKPVGVKVGNAFPQLVSEWNAEKNNHIDLKTLGVSDQKRYWWVCSKKHEWQASISNRSRGANGGTGCPVCANRVVLAGVNDLGTTNPELAREWDYSRNAPLTPREVVAGTPKKFWWTCSFGHSWQVAPRFRSRKGATNGCPYCGNQKVLAGYNDLQTLRPDLCKEWDEARNLPAKTSDVMPGSHKTFWWLCPEGHNYPMTLSGRTGGNSCTVCKNFRIVEGVNDLGSVSPELAIQWDREKNYPVTPKDVAPSSGQKYWWLCENGHSWKTSVAHRSNKRQCPGCVKKGYNQTLEGSFYFIEHTGKRARKIGITNSAARTDRISSWRDRGWVVLRHITSSNGSAIADLETQVERWIRDELRLPRFLSPSDMDGMGGWSETFSGDDEPSNLDVISKINDLWDKVQRQHN